MNTWNIRNGKSKKKISRTVRFEVCSIEILNMVAVQISEILRGFVWGKKLLEGKAFVDESLSYCSSAFWDRLGNLDLKCCIKNVF